MFDVPLLWPLSPGDPGPVDEHKILAAVMTLGCVQAASIQLARHLGIPSAIIRERPSPGMLKGIGDEMSLGFSYYKLDRVAYVVERGLPKEVLLRGGIDMQDYEAILARHRNTASKRVNPHLFPRINP